MKNSRHTRILEIIGDYVIETQDDLIEKLKESGYPVTQATVSRDIKQLGLIKTATKDGGYKYTAARNENIFVSISCKKLYQFLIGSCLRNGIKITSFTLYTASVI